MKEVVCMLQHNAREGGSVGQYENDPIVLIEEGRRHDRKEGNYRKGATIMDILVRRELA